MIYFYSDPSGKDAVDYDIYRKPQRPKAIEIIKVISGRSLNRDITISSPPPSFPFSESPSFAFTFSTATLSLLSLAHFPPYLYSSINNGHTSTITLAKSMKALPSPIPLSISCTIATC